MWRPAPSFEDTRVQSGTPPNPIGTHHNILRSTCSRVQVQVQTSRIIGNTAPPSSIPRQQIHPLFEERVTGVGLSKHYLEKQRCTYRSERCQQAPCIARKDGYG